VPVVALAVDAPLAVLETARASRVVAEAPELPALIAVTDAEAESVLVPAPMPPALAVSAAVPLRAPEAVPDPAAAVVTA